MTLLKRFSQVVGQRSEVTGVEPSGAGQLSFIKGKTEGELPLCLDRSMASDSRFRTFDLRPLTSDLRRREARRSR